MAQKKLSKVSYSIPEPKENTEPITFRVPTSLKERLEAFSEENQIKSTDLLRHIINEFLEAQGA